MSTVSDKGNFFQHFDWPIVTDTIITVKQLLVAKNIMQENQMNRTNRIIGFGAILPAQGFGL